MINVLSGWSGGMAVVKSTANIGKDNCRNHANLGFEFALELIDECARDVDSSRQEDKERRTGCFHPFNGAAMVFVTSPIYWGRTFQAGTAGTFCFSPSNLLVGRFTRCGRFRQEDKERRTVFLSFQRGSNGHCHQPNLWGSHIPSRNSRNLLFQPIQFIGGQIYAMWTVPVRRTRKDERFFLSFQRGSNGHCHQPNLLGSHLPSRNNPALLFQPIQFMGGQIYAMWTAPVRRTRKDERFFYPFNRAAMVFVTSPIYWGRTSQSGTTPHFYFSPSNLWVGKFTRCGQFPAGGQGKTNRFFYPFNGAATVIVTSPIYGGRTSQAGATQHFCFSPSNLWVGKFTRCGQFPAGGQGKMNVFLSFQRGSNGFCHQPNLLGSHLPSRNNPALLFQPIQFMGGQIYATWTVPVRRTRKDERFFLSFQRGGNGLVTSPIYWGRTSQAGTTRHFLFQPIQFIGGQIYAMWTVAGRRTRKDEQVFLSFQRGSNGHCHQPNLLGSHLPSRNSRNLLFQPIQFMGGQLQINKNALPAKHCEQGV